jgi:hypothetical protein
LLLEGSSELAQRGQVQGIDLLLPGFVPRQVQGIAEVHHREASLPQHFLLRLAFHLLGDLTSLRFPLRLALGLLLGEAFLVGLAFRVLGLLLGGFLGLLGLLLGVSLPFGLALGFFLGMALLLDLFLSLLASLLRLFPGATLPLGLGLGFFFRQAFFLRLCPRFPQLRPPPLRLRVGEEEFLALLIPRDRQLVLYRPEPSPQRLAVDGAFPGMHTLQRSPSVFSVQLQHVGLRRGAPPFQRKLVEEQQLLHPELRVLLRRFHVILGPVRGRHHLQRKHRRRNVRIVGRPFGEVRVLGLAGEHVEVGKHADALVVGIQLHLLLVADEPIAALLFQQLAKGRKEMALQGGQQRRPGHVVVILGKIPAGEIVRPNGISDFRPRGPANRLRGRSVRKRRGRFRHGQGR